MTRWPRASMRKQGREKVAKDEGGHVTAHKIIVGVDYGTTFTGKLIPLSAESWLADNCNQHGLPLMKQRVGYVTTAKSDIDDIAVVTTWPGTSRNSETVFKIPTRIAYPHENNRIQDVKWGFQVESGMSSYSWMKLLLDKSAPVAEFDDETLALQEAAGMPVLKLPRGKDAIAVTADFLTAVYKHLLAILEKQISQETLAITPLEFWLTMPAIWSDEAQDATREAAKRAGFDSRPDDKIFMITEPEAAAIAALKKSVGDDALGGPAKGDGVLVCDCGGGTVDITTYLITETYPRLAFEELCTGIGAKCGSTTIDRSFYKLMSERFRDAFDTLPLRKRGTGSQFMTAFEQIKQDFGYSGQGHEFYELPLDMSLAEPDPELFDDDERLVKVSYQDVQDLFDPVIMRIKSLVWQQIKSANRDMGKTVINKIILVGGFGDSEYLRKALKAEFTSTVNIQILVPEHPQAAIVKGAVLRGLEGVRPTTRRCRRHYGYACGMGFREGIDAEDIMYINPFNGKKYADGRMKWMVEKGEKMADSTTRVLEMQVTGTVPPQIQYTDLFSCSLDYAPERVEQPRVTFVGRIVSNLSNIDPALMESKINHDGVLAYRLPYQVEMHFGSKEGVLKFKTVVDGKVCGEAAIDFSKD